MSKWISIKDESPKLYDCCLVMNRSWFINYAVYTIDNECDGTRDDKYFAEIESVRLEDGCYDCQDTGAEILNVTHFIELPTCFDDGLGWLRDEISKTVVQKSYKRDWFYNCKPDEDY